MDWVEQLEYRCQDIINEKKELWFQTEITRDDIETMMSQMIRLYQSGKYMLIRALIETNKLDKSINCIAYDENEFGFDLEKLQSEQNIIPLLLIEGVKFSSRSFEISIKLIQVMVIGEIKQKTSCLIKRNKISEPLKEKEELILNLGQTNIEQTNIEQTNIEQTNIEPEIVLEEDEINNNQNIVIEPSPENNQAKDDTIRQNTDSDFLEEVILEVDSSVDDDSINLKNPNEVYYEIYQKARENAKEYRTKAMESYLEAKRIKTKYMLFDIDESDDSDDDENNNSI
jgi:hypothetical protein